MASRWHGQLQRRDDREMAMSEANKTFQTLAEQKKRLLCPVPEPPSPGRDWRWWSLWIPPVISAIGLFLFNIPGLGFIQLRSMPPSWLTFLVMAGAIGMAFGSDIGSVFAIWEIFRKYVTGNLTGWDKAGLVISFSASVSCSFMTWAWGLKESLGMDAWWIPIVMVYGPLIVTTMVIGDFTISCIEAGLYLGSHDQRRRDWERNEYKPWRIWMAQSTGWAEMPTLEPVRKSASKEDTQEFYITKPTKPLTDLERALEEGKTPEQIAILWNQPLPIIKRLIAEKGEQ